MAIDFPNSPAIGATYSVGSKFWSYNGTSWELSRQTYRQEVNAQAGSYTLLITDAEKLITFSGAATLTVPLNSSVAFAIGTRIDIAVLAAVAVQVSFTGGITSYYTPGRFLTVSAGAMATLQKIGTDTWLLVGMLIT